jgi:hypothetical protein
MKDRRPRKLKKILKARFAKATALRIVQAAIMTTLNICQMASVSALPTPNPNKAIAVAQIAIETANALTQVMKSGPQNWRDA